MWKSKLNPFFSKLLQLWCLITTVTLTRTCTLIHAPEPRLPRNPKPILSGPQQLPLFSYTVCHHTGLGWTADPCSSTVEVGMGYTKDLYHPGKKPGIKYYVSHGGMKGQQAEPPGQSIPAGGLCSLALRNMEAEASVGCQQWS